MRRTAFFGVMSVALLSGGVGASAQEANFSILLKGNLTTRTELFPNPDAADPLVRSQSIDLVDFTGTAIELRYHFHGSGLALAISVEYQRAIESLPLVVSFNRQVPAEDGYVAIPVELTGYFTIPASTEAFKIYMGGGVGAYFGRRHYSIAGVEAGTTEARPGFGIHVLGGLAYCFNPWLSVSGEMKFRDLQFRTVNAFPVSQIPYGNAVVSVSRDPFESSVQTDGIIFQIGAAVSF
jgi:opacity protein-like surface antigen